MLAQAFGLLPEAVRSRPVSSLPTTPPGRIGGKSGTMLGSSGRSSPRMIPNCSTTLACPQAVHFTGWCYDATLRALYRSAAVMVFPSLYEGLACRFSRRCGVDVP